MADVRIENHGSIILFIPLTELAVGWCAANLPADCPSIGPAYAVECRYAGDIVHGMAADGLEL